MIGLLVRETDQRGSFCPKAKTARPLCNNTCRNLVGDLNDARRYCPKPDMLASSAARPQVKLWLKFSDEVAYNSVYAPTWMILNSKAMGGFTKEERQRLIDRIPQPERRKRWKRVSSGGFSEDELQSAADKMLLCFARCEQSLASGDFFVNGEFSLADIAMIPFVDRITNLRPEMFEGRSYPKLSLWYERMKSRTAFEMAFNFRDDPRANEMPNI
jgi:glutathione S-transferase